MAFDAHTNFAIAAVAVAPSPATSGTTLTISAGQGLIFPAAPFNAAVWPYNQISTPANAEVVRVTAKGGDVFTITRAQESSTARAIVVGDYIAAAITAKVITDIESGTNFPLLTTSGNVSMGPGGTAIANAQLTVNGSSGAGAGGLLALQANSVDLGYLARGSVVLGGTSNAMTVAAAAANTSGVVVACTEVTAPIRFNLGTALAERGRMYPSGGFAWGTVTDPGAGRAIVSGGVTSATGTTVSTAHDTWVTLFAISNAANTIGLYLVQAGLGVNDATNYGGYGIVVIDGTAARIVANNATLLELQMSGLNVQAKQKSGSAQAIKWNALRIQ